MSCGPVARFDQRLSPKLRAPRSARPFERAQRKHYFAKVFPHFVVSGDYYILPKQAVITGAVMYLDDATTLFNDFNAFGSVCFDAKPIVEQIMRKEPNGNARPTGPNARILYCLDEEELHGSHALLYSVDGEPAVTDQMQLKLTNMLRSELVGRSLEISGGLAQSADVGIYGTLGIITALEFFQHHFSEMGHRGPPL
jgi:hypothetical protein